MVPASVVGPTRIVTMTPIYVMGLRFVGTMASAPTVVTLAPLAVPAAPPTAIIFAAMKTV